MGNKEFLIATSIAQVVFLAAVVVLILFVTELIPLEGIPRYEVVKYCSISIGSLFGLSIAVFLYTLHRIFTESPVIELKRYEPSTILATLESVLESGVELETRDEPQTSRTLPLVTSEPQSSRTLQSTATDAPQTSRTLPSVSEEAKDESRTSHTLSGYKLLRKTLRDMKPEVKKMKVNVQALAHQPSARRSSFTESVEELLSAVGRRESGGIFHISIDTQDDEEFGGQDETYVVGAGGQDETSSGAAADKGELSADLDEASGQGEASVEGEKSEAVNTLSEALSPTLGLRRRIAASFRKALGKP